jgi:hypothetical protein
MSARTTWAARVPSELPDLHFGCGHGRSCLFLVRSRQFGHSWRGDVTLMAARPGSGAGHEPFGTASTAACPLNVGPEHEL